MLKRFTGSEVKGQGRVYKCVNVIIAEAYIATLWHRGSLVTSQTLLSALAISLWNIVIYAAIKQKTDGLSQ